MRKFRALGGWFLAAHLALVSGCAVQTPDVSPQSDERSAALPMGSQIAASPQLHSPAPASQSASAVSGYAFVTGERYRQLDDEGIAWLSYDALAVGDVNGDGRDDLVALPSDRRIHIFLQGGDGRLALSYRSPPNRPALSDLVLVDLNEDGVLDIATTSIQGMFDLRGGLNLLLSDGQGGWVFSQVLGHLEREARNLTVMDVDQDGHMDILGVMNLTDYSTGKDCGFTSFSSCPWLRVIYGDGRGGVDHVETVLVNEPYQIHGARSPDIDGDGRQDLVYVLSGVYGKPGRLVVRMGLPSGGLSAPRDLHSAFHSAWNAPVFGDFNSDSRLDSLQVQGDEGYPYLYLQGQGAEFAPSTFYSYQFVSTQPVAADFDGDGMTDLISMQLRRIAGSPIAEVGLGVYLQRNGSLGLPQLSNSAMELDKTISGNYGMVSGDLNSDGCRDLAVATSYEGIWFFYGSGCLLPPPAQMKSGDCRADEVLPPPSLSTISSASSPVFASKGRALHAPPGWP